MLGCSRGKLPTEYFKINQFKRVKIHTVLFSRITYLYKVKTET